MAGNIARPTTAILKATALTEGVIVVALVLMEVVYNEGNIEGAIATAPFSFAVTLPLTLIGFGTLGIAWHAMATRLGWTSAWHYLLAGIISGSIFALVILSAMAWVTGSKFLDQLWPAIRLFVPWGICVGGVAAFSFWLIRRPDRDAANPATAAP